jgi:hypothetical protein
MEFYKYFSHAQKASLNSAQWRCFLSTLYNMITIRKIIIILVCLFEVKGKISFENFQKNINILLLMLYEEHQTDKSEKSVYHAAGKCKNT